MTKKGKLNLNQIKDMINKAAGIEVAYDLRKENPAKIPFWVSTGSLVLDCTLATGIEAGIPANRIVELAGQEGTGKSYLAVQIAVQAQKEHGMPVIWFESENTISEEFLIQAGIDLSKFLYVQAFSCEFLFDRIKDICNSIEEPYLFVWDSLAMTPTEAMLESETTDQPKVATQARVVSDGLKKLIVPMSFSKSSLLVLNQLKTKIGGSAFKFSKGIIDQDTFFANGGRTLRHAFSIRIWLTKPSGKKWRVLDENGNQIGSHVKVHIVKSRFGTENRECEIDIQWGGNDVRIMDEENWFEVLKDTDILKAGAWNKLTLPDGTEESFRKDDWSEVLNKEGVRKYVKDHVRKKLIHEFAHKNTEGLSIKVAAEEVG